MDVIFVLLLILLGFLFINRFRSKLSSKSLLNLKLLWVFHLLFTVVYYFFTRNGGGDSWGYWRRSQEMAGTEFWEMLTDAQGTHFIDALNYIPANFLGMGFLANSLLYSFLGFCGFVYFYLIAIRTIKYNPKLGKYSLFPAVFFLPNLHFWTAGVGKDSLLFFSIGLFSYSLSNLPRKFVGLALSLLLAYLIRPHMAFFLLVSFGVVYLIESKAKTYKRILFSLVFLIAGLYIFPIVMEFAKIEEASVESFDKFSDKHVELLKSGSGSAINISDYPLPLKIFTFLYRPLFFDIHNAPGILASFENLFLLVLSFKVFSKNLFRSFNRAPFLIKGLFIFLLIGAVAFSLTLSNLGIMLRMRNMFLPGFLIYLLWSLSYQQEVWFKKNKIRKVNKAL